MPQYLDFTRVTEYPPKWLQFCPSLWVEGRENFLEEMVQVPWGLDETWHEERTAISYISSSHSFFLVLYLLLPDKLKIGLFLNLLFHF